MTTSTALTIAERVEQSPAMLQLDARAQSLIELLPDEAAARRFRQVVTQALIKTPALLSCTPESVVSSVFEAAAMGLEPTGAAGGAHLVPYGDKAQLIPDYRGIIRLVTKPPSDVLSIEARTVKEGDEFSYDLGTDAQVRHVPSLAPDRSAHVTTHVYAIARLRSGVSLADVMDRAEIERIQKRGRNGNSGPWASDWDEMAKKTVIKRLAKVLPVRPDVRSILLREDELSGEVDTPPTDPNARPAASRTARLVERLRPAPTTAQDELLGSNGTGGHDDSHDAGTAEPGLTRVELVDALDAAGIAVPYAVETAKTRFGASDARSLTNGQRAELLAVLLAEQAAETPADL